MAGAALYEIQKNGFEITAIQTVNFTKPNAEEFLEVYKGVVQEYPVCVCGRGKRTMRRLNTNSVIKRKWWTN